MDNTQSISINYQLITPSGARWRHTTLCRLKRHALWAARMAERYGRNNPRLSEDAEFYSIVLGWDLQCDDCTPQPFHKCWLKLERLYEMEAGITRNPCKT